MTKEGDKPARKRRRYTIAKLIKPELERLHPGAKWDYEKHQGKTQVAIEVPAETAEPDKQRT